MFLLAFGSLSFVQADELRAQSSLPATSPTAVSAPLAATPDGPASRKTQKAQVTFENGLLDIRANNSSLNGILREIARSTGMKLTGGVAEQRVFGNYGPAAPSTVLATLLDGTGSNMLLREAADASPEELILTPRTGGPSPPSPASYSSDDEGSGSTPASSPPPGPADPAIYGRHGSIGAGLPLPPGAAGGGNGGFGPRSLGQPMNNVNGSPNNVSPTASTYPTTNSVPLDSVPTPSITPAVSGIVDAPNPSPFGTTTSTAIAGTTDQQPASSDLTAAPAATTTFPTPVAPDAAGGTSNGSTADTPKTPEQVFQLLQQLRQQSIQQQKQ